MEGAPSQLRPLGLGEIIDSAISLFRANFGPLLATVAVAVVPAQILSLILLLGAPDGAAGLLLGTSDTTDDVEGGAFVAVMVVTLVSSLAFALAIAAAYRFVSEVYLGVETDWRGSIEFALRRFRSILWILLLVFLGMVLGFIALIIPGIWLAVAWSLAIPVLLSEGTRGSKALGRSHRLVKGHWWHAAGALFVAYLLVAVLQFVLGFLIGLATAGAESSKEFDAVLATVVNLVLSLLAVPFTTAVLALIYFDLRVRKEGVDLAMDAEGIGSVGGGRGTPSPAVLAPPPPPPPPPSET